MEIDRVCLVVVTADAVLIDVPECGSLVGVHQHFLTALVVLYIVAYTRLRLMARPAHQRKVSAAMVAGLFPGFAHGQELVHGASEYMSLRTGDRQFRAQDTYTGERRRRQQHERAVVYRVFAFAFGVTDTIQNLLRVQGVRPCLRILSSGLLLCGFKEGIEALFNDVVQGLHGAYLIKCITLLLGSTRGVPSPIGFWK